MNTCLDYKLISPYSSLSALLPRTQVLINKLICSQAKFERLREQVGETEYLEAMELAGVQNPGQFHSADKALDCYWRLARIAAQPEVA